MLRFTGYRLLVHQDQDQVELLSAGETLRVRGRGASHQVDVLGEFGFTPAFSMPVRLFLEAKFYRDQCGLEVVRNAHGVVHDVNENFMTYPGSRPRRRCQYSYALASANGFTAEAQKYALAHQISLVDLSGASFQWLLSAISSTAWTLFEAQKHLGRSESFPVIWLRAELRRALETSPVNLLPQATISEGRFRQVVDLAIGQMVAVLCQHSDSELLLGFPSARFILPLAASDHRRFLAYADANPDHTVRLRRRGHGEAAEWTVAPVGAVHSYELAFKLPEHVEAWITGVSDKERQRTVEVEQQFLSTITIYRMNGEGVRAYQLRYEASSLSRG